MMLIPIIADRNAFGPYGDIIRSSHREPKEFITSAFSRCEPDLKYALSVNSLLAYEEPVIAVSSMERHPHSSQIFIPLTPGNYLSVVGLSGNDDTVDRGSVKAFLVPRTSGIVYHPGTWHFGFTAVGARGDVAVIIGMSGQGSDTECVNLSDTIRVDLSAYRENAS
ncbi:Ureidoglycolate lyase OS=Castellaniella defragrans OX=75697 GN=allA PE=3 SV=1 [Castellaniella defragrans]